MVLSYKDKILLDLFENVIMVVKKNQRFEKIAAQTFEAGDFLNIFWRFCGSWGSLSYKTFSKKKKSVPNHVMLAAWNNYVCHSDKQQRKQFLTFHLT